jgi:hypothetical protein
MTIPYGTIHKLAKPLYRVRCENYSGDYSRHVLAAGQLVRLNNVSSARETSITVVDVSDKSPGIEIRLNTGRMVLGYRFEVNNEALGEAIGIEFPETTPDLLGDLIEYESGGASPSQTLRLFRELRRSGIGAKLQGHYISRM